MIWNNYVGSLSSPSTGHIPAFYSHFLIDFLLLVQKWANSQYQAKACLKITYIELKHIHWELKRKSWVITLRSHDFFDRLHDFISIKSSHNIILLLLYRDDNLFYQVAGLASSKKNYQKTMTLLSASGKQRTLWHFKKYWDVCFI